jgi:hypothetical protein
MALMVLRNLEEMNRAIFYMVSQVTRYECLMEDVRP